jgi:hypothetical protein
MKQWNKMRSILHGPEAFLLKSKKPRIQELVAKATSMSVEEIEKLDEKADIKRGLVNIKKSFEQNASVFRAELLADMMIAKHHPEFNRQTIKN